MLWGEKKRLMDVMWTMAGKEKMIRQRDKRKC